MFTPERHDRIIQAPLCTALFLQAAAERVRSNTPFRSTDGSIGKRDNSTLAAITLHCISALWFPTDEDVVRDAYDGPVRDSTQAKVLPYYMQSAFDVLTTGCFHMQTADRGCRLQEP